MPDAKSFQAATDLVSALRQFFVAVGPWRSILLAIILVGGPILLHIMRGRKVDTGWNRALSAKDAMIDQLNEQNRLLRVEMMIHRGQFSKEEAVRLVYGEDLLAAHAENGPPGDKRR
jgi:hypothetical protein